MSVRPGRGGRRRPPIKSSTYCDGTWAASANSSAERLISLSRWRNSTRTAGGSFWGWGNGTCGLRLLVAIGDVPTSEIIGREGHGDTVTLEHPNPETPHLPGHGRQRLVPVFQGHAEHGVGQNLGYGPVHQDSFFLGHGRSPSGRAGTKKEGPARGPCLG